MQRLLMVGALLGLVSPVAAQADEINFPRRHPGLWEQSIGAGDAKLVSKICIDEASDRKLLDYGFAKMRQMGGTFTVTGSGNRFHVLSVNTVSGHTITSNLDLEFKSDKLIESSGRSHIDPPIEGMPTDSEIKQESKWTGPCPADMEPGDVVSNGRKHNILKEQAAGK